MPFLTPTEEDQQQTEGLVLEKIQETQRLHGDANVPLFSAAHERFLRSSLDGLISPYISLDSSRTWIMYWIWHSMKLLKRPLSPHLHHAAAGFLKLCQAPSGGFAGSPMPSLPHTVATYSAVMALACVGTEESLSVINRSSLHDFLLSMKHPSGAFQSHQDGECDVRAAYCAIAVASLCNILSPQLIHKTKDWVMQCQHADGGFAGVPNGEPHAGYTYCATACLGLLNDWEGVDKAHLKRWLVLRQRSTEGGFDGRPNKLVDSCYSFWNLGSLAIVDPQSVDAFNKEALKTYILGACQGKRGGLKDKPGKPVDFYHTCYALSGLSLTGLCELDEVNPVYNVVRSKAEFALEHFKK
ncbi:hypothetical protein P9112_012765 [Eukaryota sp. TZLM1-RC]